MYTEFESLYALESICLLCLMQKLELRDCVDL